MQSNLQDTNKEIITIYKQKIESSTLITIVRIQHDFYFLLLDVGFISSFLGVVMDGWVKFTLDEIE